MTRELKFGRRAALSGQPRSVVVFLHGYGADGADLLGLADPMAPHLRNTVFVAPDAPEPCSGNPFGRQWFPIPWLDGSSELAAATGLARSAQDLDGFLDARMKDEKIDAQHVALVGFSQGSMMALHVSPRRDVAICCRAARTADPVLATSMMAFMMNSSPGYHVRSCRADDRRR